LKAFVRMKKLHVGFAKTIDSSFEIPY